MRIALGLEYDGTGFHGWQSQSEGNTVQDAVEAALAIVADHSVRVHCAGRTDAGVHATAQVLHFDTEARRPLNAWVRGVNANLPDSIAIRWAQPVNDDFHARFSARARRYRYLLLNRPERPGLLHGRVGWYHRSLELKAMQSAAASLLGEHDFSAFRAAGCQAKSPVKKLSLARVSCHRDLFVFEFEASAFLHHMVRNLVGSLVHVGKGAEPADWLSRVLVSRDRSVAAATFDANGLYFAGVEYDVAFGLPKVMRSGIHKDGAGETALLF